MACLFSICFCELNYTLSGDGVEDEESCVSIGSTSKTIRCSIKCCSGLFYSVIHWFYFCHAQHCDDRLLASIAILRFKSIRSYALHDTGLPHRIDRILCPYANTSVVGIERRTDFDISIQHRIKALQDNRRFLSGKLARGLEGAVLITGDNTECRDLTYYVFIAVGERLCQFRQIDVWVYRLNGLPSQLAEFIAVDIQALN